jgi:glycosyltransferase involved in cell wall biosynthesis
VPLSPSRPLKLSVVIPVYNERRTIADLVSRVRAVRDVDLDIILVDDGSTDGTVEVLRRLQAEQADLRVVFKPRNSGKGDSLRIGFAHVTGDYVIIQDADLEYDPQDYRKLLAALAGAPRRVVYGSRFSERHHGASRLHYAGNQFLTAVTNALYGSHLTDMETCFKLIPAGLLSGLDIRAKRFDFEPEVTAKLLRSGVELVEVPISYRGRTAREGKKITWRDAFSAVWTLARYRFWQAPAGLTVPASAATSLGALTPEDPVE